MLEVNGGNDYKIWRMGKQSPFTSSWISTKNLVSATDEALQVAQMFSGDGGKISNIGDNDLDAGACDGAIDQMIMPIAAI